MNKKVKPPEPILPPEDICLAALDQELERWQTLGTKPRVFLRDDDAIEATPALEMLADASGSHGVPLLLATIPQPAKQELAAFIESRPWITPAVHGYRHQNHSPKGEKTCELGRHRAPSIVLDELKEGREKLGNLFKGNLSGLLVPPWNRIHDEVIPLSIEAGFAGLSTHAWLKQPMALPMVNTHVDIIHWSGGTIGREHNWVWHHVTQNLKTARLKGNRAIGILTHHLVHDEKAWAMLDKLFRRLNGKVDWVSADSLLSEPQEPLQAA